MNNFIFALLGIAVVLIGIIAVTCSICMRRAWELQVETNEEVDRRLELLESGRLGGV